jgi:hypothetical protein
MMIRIFAWLQTIIALVFTLACTAFTTNLAHAENVETKWTKLRWREAQKQFVSVCYGPNQHCSPVKMPKRLGLVKRVYTGPIVKNTRASWLAISEHETFVCAVVLNSVKVACAKIANEMLPYSLVVIRIKYTPAGQTRIALRPATELVDSLLVKDLERKFNQSYSKSVAILQGEVDAVTFMGSSFSSTMSVCDQNGPGPAPQPECELQDGAWACPGPKPYDECTIAPGPIWACPVVGDRPDPDPDPDPEPDPEPCEEIPGTCTYCE